MRRNEQAEKQKHGIAYDTSSPLEKGRAEGAGWMCLEEAPLLRSGQYDNSAKRYSISTSEAKPWALYFTRIRVNAQEEKRKHGITCHTSSPLEKGRAEGAG